MMKTKFLLIPIALFLLLPVQTTEAQRRFVHPGITYTQGDIDRMKAMVEARREPYYSTYQALLSSNYSQIGNGNYAAYETIASGRFNATIGSDGRRAHDLALLYHITGNRAYANDAVARLNRYKNLYNASSRGTGPLDNGKIYLLMEAAELMRDFDGWSAADQQAFKAAMVYPFYSTTRTAESYKSNDDSKNRVSIYWNIYQFDPGRFGNQGLFAARGLMAMGIYLDNDTIYDRAYRYLACLPSRADDHNYKPGPPVRGSKISESGTQIDYNVSWPSGGAEYFSDEALKYYIYANGQNQESSRDQGHVMAGLGNYTAIAEIAWSQGDSLYSWLDNRILLGLEYNIRYNLSSVNSYADQPQPWEPTGASKNEADCTFDNGVFYQSIHRSKRWESKAISTAGRGNVFGSGGWKTQALQHYKVRAGLPAEKYKWLQRAYDKMINDYSIENWGVAPNWFYEWCGWGTLTKTRSAWMAGDPVTWVAGERVSGMPKAPCTVKAVDYDFYSENGEGRTYHNGGKTKSTLYRTDGTIEIARDGDDYVVTDMLAGEWMNYSVVFPAPAGNTTAGITKKYNIYVTYKSAGAGVKLFAAIDNDAVRKGKELEPASEWTERRLGTFEVPCGAAVVRLYVKGVSNLLQLKSIRIEPVSSEELAKVDLNAIATAKVYDAENTNITESNLAVIAAATDGDKSAPINLPHQKFLVYDFGEDGLDIRDVTLYNDGVTMDTREQAKALGSTANGKYTGAWDRNAASDILRTNGVTYTLKVPVMNNSWVTTDGSNGAYQVGPLGKYRYFCFYNWSATGRISELEIRSIVSSGSVGEDAEPSAEWDNTDDTGNNTAILTPETAVKVLVNGHIVTVPGASGIEAYTLTGSRLAVSKSEQITLPSGLYILKIKAEEQTVNRKVAVK